MHVRGEKAQRLDRGHSKFISQLIILVGLLHMQPIYVWAKNLVNDSHRFAWFDPLRAISKNMFHPHFKRPPSGVRRMRRLSHHVIASSESRN